MRAAAVAAVLIVVSSLAGVAAAQPGQTPVGPPIPPPYTYQPAPPPPVQLTQDEIELLADGEITDGQHIGGGVASIFLGFGIGQAIQGRWSDKGWIFTVGDTVAYGLIIYGLSKNDCWLFHSSCDDEDDGVGEVLAGLLTAAVFRTWEIIDAFAAPPAHNRRVRMLQMRLGYPPPVYGGIKPYVVPAASGDGAFAGVTLRF